MPSGKRQVSTGRRMKSDASVPLIISFRKIYLACGGDKLLPTTGDALLTFIQIYGYDALWQKSESLLKKIWIKAWGDRASAGEQDD